MIPNHDLDVFCKTFNVPAEDISWARLVLEKGVSTEVFSFYIVGVTEQGRVFVCSSNRCLHRGPRQHDPCRRIVQEHVGVPADHPGKAMQSLKKPLVQREVQMLPNIVNSSL